MLFEELLELIDAEVEARQIREKARAEVVVFHKAVIMLDEFK